MSKEARAELREAFDQLICDAGYVALTRLAAAEENYRTNPSGCSELLFADIFRAVREEKELRDLIHKRASQR